MTAPAIFDRAVRRQRRDRAVANFQEHNFIRAVMLDGLAERLSAITRSFHDVLDLGCFDGSFSPPDGASIARLDPSFGFARAAAGIVADEDLLPFADATFDAVVSAGLLDQVSDLPGALMLARRVLRPDGVFLAAMIGAGSFPLLRQILRVADYDKPVARLHPQIDVRAGGDLMVRAGFALPVADTETLEVGYRDMFRLFDDLRGAAMSNIMTERHPLTRRGLARAAEAFAAAADASGRARERIEILYLTGWSPAPSQPQPARRGSATASLAATLRRP